MAILKILVFVAILSTTKGCSEGDIQLLLTTGAVQLCDRQSRWRSICNNNNWNQKEANIACYQLGYSNKGAVAGTECLSNGRYVSIQCTGTETKLSDCSTTNGCSNECGGWRSSGHRTSVVTCAPANCTNGEIRLVGGSTNREGRVEVCVDGRWGTVCNSNPPLAGAVCSQLGFPALGAKAVSRFGPGFVQIRSCTVQTGGSLSCSPITDRSCDHSMDLGVVCRTCEHLYSELPNQCSNTTTCPTCEEPATAESCATSTPSPVTTECVCPTCEDSTPCPTTICPIVVNPPTELCNCSNCTCPSNITEPACDCPTSTPPPVTTESHDCPKCEDPTPCPAITCPTCPTINETPCPTITVNQHGIIQPSQTCPVCPSLPNTASIAITTSGQNRTVSDQNTQGQTGGRVEGCNCISAPLLGGVVGVLVIVLVILVIGWCFSCVVLVKRNSQTEKQKHFNQTNNNDDSTLERQLDNPVYDSNMETNNDDSTLERQMDNPVYDTNMDTNNYGSSGPTYELVDTSEGAGLIYSALDQCKESSQMAAENDEHYYHVLESGESEGVAEGVCDYEVPVSGQTHSRVKLCEEEYSTLQH